MAMGLGCLGREHVIRRLEAALFHLAGAAVGGAAVGLALGVVGGLFDAGPSGVWVVSGAAIVSLVLARRAPNATIGVNRQVPRSWQRSLAPDPCYFLWGFLLGSGVATVVPYSCLLVLFAMQLSTNVTLALVAGAIYGVARELTPLLVMLLRYSRNTPGMMDLLPDHGRIMVRLNVAFVVASPILVATIG